MSRALRAIGLYLPFETGKRTLIRRYAPRLCEAAIGARPVRVRRAGLDFELDLSDEIQQWIFLTGWWEKADLKAAIANLGEGQIVMDIGANIGFFSLHASRAVGPTGSVLAFEPNSRICSRLRRNLEINRLTNVLVEGIALSDHGGDARFFLRQTGSSGHATLFEACLGAANDERSGTKALEKIQVPLCTLDSYCEENSINRIDYIKLDVEGAEPFVLLGGQETLRSCRPSMLIECNRHTLHSAGWQVQRFLELIWELGYETLRPSRFSSRLRPVTSADDLPEPIYNLHCRPW